MTEKQFQKQVIELARLAGYRVAHFRPAWTRDGKMVTPVQANGAGFPDLVLANPKRHHLLFAELKVGKNKLTPEQKEWLHAILSCNVAYFTWYPEDWDDIKRILGVEEA